MTFTYAQRGYLSAYRQTMEAMGIPQEEIEAATPWLKICSASSADASITISTTGTKVLRPSLIRTE